jgi:type VI secretion system protein ImpA
MNARWEGRDLLQPITADAPCGESLEDTQLLASFDAFRVFGQATLPEPTPEWGQIKDKAIDALGKSKDIRLLAYLASALLRTDGLAAFSQTLSVAAYWLDTYWSQAYPLVTEDAILRRNALNCFADQIAVVDGVRRAPLITSRVHGTFSLRDLDIATGQVVPRNGEPRPDEQLIKAALAIMPLEELVSLHDNVTEAAAALKRIDARMRDEAGSEATPNFDSIATQLGKIERVLATQRASRPGGDVEAASTAADTGATGTAIGVIRSRQDAIAALDAVAEFFRRTEPSSPIPMFLERSKRLVSKDFLEVLADIAPEAVPQARAAGGLRQGE